MRAEGVKVRMERSKSDNSKAEQIGSMAVRFAKGQTSQKNCRGELTLAILCRLGERFEWVVWKSKVKASSV